MRITGNPSHVKQLEAFELLTRMIEGAQKIVLCAHTRPDGDALGSVLAMGAIIREAFDEDKDVVCLLADEAAIPATYEFLPEAKSFVRPSQYEEDPDLFIALDLPCASRLAAARPIMERSAAVAVVDHHPADGSFGEPHIERTDAAATGVVVAEYALFLGTPITPEIATDLFCVIQTDTGRFMYQNANPEAFKIASLLVDSGADPSEISLHVYQSFRLPYLHLESIVMGRIVTLDHGRIAYSYATRRDLERTGAKDDECDGLIDVVRSVRGSEVALFLKEGSIPGIVRGNLRAKGDLDVSGIARAMGGGGHKAAAGFSVEGTVDDVFARVFPLLRALVAKSSLKDEVAS